MVGTEGDDMQQLIDQVAHCLENPPQPFNFFAAYAGLSKREQKRVGRIFTRWMNGGQSPGLTGEEIIRAAQARDAA